MADAFQSLDRQLVRIAWLTESTAANMPSPPPPYSPSVDQAPNLASPVMSSGAFAPNRASPHNSFRDISSPINPSNLVSPVSSISHFDQQRLSVASHESPRGTTPPAFPPPPSRSGRDRSGSRNKPEGRSILSGLSALAGRNRSGESSQAPNAIDSLRHNTSEALARHAPPQM